MTSVPISQRVLGAISFVPRITTEIHITSKKVRLQTILFVVCYSIFHSGSQHNMVPSATYLWKTVIGRLLQYRFLFNMVEAAVL